MELWNHSGESSTLDAHTVSTSSVSPKYKNKGGGRYKFSMRSKQIIHSSDHIKGNQVRKGGGGSILVPPLGETLTSLVYFPLQFLFQCCS